MVIISLTTGQVIDECLSKSCEVCKSREKKRSTPEFDKWARQHVGECQSNFQGSSESMDSEKTLPEKYVGSYTQNQNEALKYLIRSFCAKIISCKNGYLPFNNGYTAIHCEISPGRNLTRSFLGLTRTE